MSLVNKFWHFLKKYFKLLIKIKTEKYINSKVKRPKLSSFIYIGDSGRLFNVPP